MKKSDPRHIARIASLQKLFERDFNTHDVAEGYPLEYDLDDLKEIIESDFDESLFNKLLEGTIKFHSETDKIIIELAPEWPIDMINKVDLQILRMSIFEGFIGRITPVKVVIDEAIELGKEFGGKPSAKFINGVLGNLVENDKLKEKLGKLNER